MYILNNQFGVVQNREAKCGLHGAVKCDASWWKPASFFKALLSPNVINLFLNWSFKLREILNNSNIPGGAKGPC